MPSRMFADRPSAQPPERGALEALITQTRHLRGSVDAVRRDATPDGDDARARWQRALCDLAVHHLDDVGQQLSQLHDGLPDLEDAPDEAADAPVGAGLVPKQSSAPAHPPVPGQGSLLRRVGSAEWNLLTDEIDWSEELFRIFGRDPQDGPLSLDELPSWVPAEDQPLLTELVTDCLVEGKHIDGEFRIVRSDGVVRTIHMTGEPVLDSAGTTASMWAVVRDVSELRRTQRAVDESRDGLRLQRRIARTEHRLAVEFQEAVVPPWRGSLRLGADGPLALDVAAHYLPSEHPTLIGGTWYDALQLPGGRTLFGVGELTGHGVAATSGTAMLLGALRGLALAGTEPGALLDRLNQLLEVSSQPALGSALCCLFDSGTRTLTWARAGHPAPVLLRDGAFRTLDGADGTLLGATPRTEFGQATAQLHPGDLLLLHTDSLTAGPVTDEAAHAVGAGGLGPAGLDPGLLQGRGAQDCVRILTQEFGGEGRESDACVLAARLGG